MISNRQLFLNHLAQTTNFPMALEIVRGEGCYLFDVDEKKYIDLISGIGVSSVGHCHPEVVAAVTKQASTYMHVMVYGEYIQSPQINLAKVLCDSLPEKIDNAYLVNSGSEAVEAAMKLAKRYTGRKKIVHFKNSYHGSTQGALSIAGDEHLKRNYRPLLPGIQTLAYNNFDQLELIDQAVAAVFIETVQGEAGVRMADSQYFNSLQAKCRQTGSLLIVDEIQCGMGRTGKLWAFEHFGLTPDIVIAAKALGGGMPIGALMAPHAIMSAFTENPILGHITTFGGHPVSSAAALAALNIVNDPRLLAQVEDKANRFLKNLQHPKIKAIRNCGLMLAVEFESFDQLKAIIDKAISLGVITDWFLFCDNAMRIAPPLTISIAEIDEACKKLMQAINEAI